MGRTLVQWASHATWSAPRRAACIGISQQWRAYVTDGNSVTQAQVTTINKNFINLTVGRRTETPFWSRERRDFWAFQNPRCPLLALLGAGGGDRHAPRDGCGPWVGLKRKLLFRDRGRAFFGQIGILDPRVCLARFTDSPVVSTQPDPRFSPVNTLPLCINSSCCCMLACSCLHHATKRPGADVGRLPSI